MMGEGGGHGEQGLATVGGEATRRGGGSSEGFGVWQGEEGEEGGEGEGEGGGEEGLVSRGRAEMSGARQMLQTGFDPCSANGDPSLDGVVRLGIDAPHGRMVEGAIAGWEFGKVVGSINRFTLGAQPVVSMLDNRGDVVSRFCPGNTELCSCRDVVYDVSVRLFNNPGCSLLTGTTTVTTVNGIARFTDLQMANPAYENRLIFEAGVASAPLTVISPPFQNRVGQLFVPVHDLWNIEGGPLFDGNCTVCPDLNGALRATPCRVLVAGDNIMDLSEQRGFKYPTVWVRRYDSSAQTSGTEGDGWVDIVDYSRDVSVEMQDPGCDARGNTDVTLCRQGLGGTTTIKGYNVQENQGKAVFTDLRVYAAGSTLSLVFTSMGMQAVAFPLKVIPSCAYKVIVLRHVSSFTLSGLPFAMQPIAHLVDRYNNSIVEKGWEMPITACCNSVGQSVAVLKCNNIRCVAFRPYLAASAGIIGESDALPGVVTFTDLVVTASGVDMRLTFGAQFPANTSRTVLSAVSEPFTIQSASLAKLILGKQPRTENWVSQNVIPLGATAGYNFAEQPQLNFVDSYENVVPSVQGVDVTVTVTGSNPPTLFGTTTVTTVDGIAQFTDLRIDATGQYRLLFVARALTAISDSFQITFGTMERLPFARNLNNVASTTSASGHPDQKQLIMPQPEFSVEDIYKNKIVGFNIDFQVSLENNLANTVLVCDQCFSGILFVSTTTGTVKFTDLAITVDPTTNYQEGLQLKIQAVNKQLCDVIGTGINCRELPGMTDAESPLVVQGKRHSNFSSTFGVYKIDQISVLSQPDSVSSAAS